MNGTRAPARPILYRQLTLRLMIPLVLIVAVVGAFGLYSTGSETATVFDRWLLDAAVSLADQVRSGNGGEANAVDLPEAARTMLAYDEIDHTWFSVQDRGRVLIGSAGIPTSGSNDGRLRRRARVRRRLRRRARCAWPRSARRARAASTWWCWWPRRCSSASAPTASSNGC